MATPSVINDHNWQQFINPVIDGERKMHGLIPRDLQLYPPGCYRWAEPFPDSLLVPEDEIDQRIKEQEAQQASLLDMRNNNYNILKSLDQDSLGLCWAFSTTKTMMYLRVLMNEPGLILSAWYVAGMVKNWRDQGGWGSESLDFVVANGVPEYSLCPSYSSQYATPATAQNAKLHLCLEWWEGSEDPDKAFHQACSAYLMGLPTINDYNWWSHSVCGIKAVSYKSPSLQIDNSWGESAGDKGIYTLEASKAKPNGLWIPRVQMPSPT